MRILITGSRNWSDYALLKGAIEEQISFAFRDREHCVVVHGGARGADKMATDVVRPLSWVDLEVHPAQWRPYGIYNPQAGLIRNREMVELGADVCLAFIKNGSRGATHCADLAEAAGIPTKRFEA